MKFFTWNSQGDFTTPAKSNVVKTLMLNHGCAIGFIQEGGTDTAGRAIPAGVRAFSGATVGAKNERCTNYVLINTNVIKEGETFEIFDVIVAVDQLGHVVLPQPAAIRLGNAIYVSWHSLSGESNTDTSALLDECKQKQGVTTIVIGGDFNTLPINIENMVTSKAAQRGANSNFSWVEKSGMPTHASLSGSKNRDEELDFFVVIHNAPVKAAKVQCWPAFVSDHDPVIMDIPLCGDKS